MSLRDAFENFWRRRFGSEGVGGGLASIPELDCVDSRGESTATAVMDSLAKCRERMANLRQLLRDEEYLEEFLSGILRDGQGLLQEMAVHRGIHGQETSSDRRESDVERGKACVTPSESLPSGVRYTIAERRQQFEVLAKVEGGSIARKALKSIQKKPCSKIDPAGSACDPCIEKDKEQGNSKKPNCQVTVSETKDMASSQITSFQPLSASIQISNHDNDSLIENGAEQNKDQEDRLRNDKSKADSKLNDDLMCRTGLGDSQNVICNEMPGSVDTQVKPKKIEEKVVVESMSTVSPALHSKEFGSSKSVAEDAVSITSSSSICRSLPGSVRRKNQIENGDHEDSNNDDDDEDDEAINLMVLRQSVTFANKWCEGVDSSRTRLEEQAQRLSKRFTQSLASKALDISKSQELGVLIESPMSPSSLSGGSEPFGGTDADWCPTSTLLASICVTEELNRNQTLEKLDMRRCVVNSLLDSERSYMEILDSLMGYKQMFKNFANTQNSVLNLGDIEIIFYGVADLHKIHYQFVRDLEPKVANWSADHHIAEIFKILALEEYSIAPDYLRNYSRALSTIHSCRQENQKFDLLTREITYRGSEKTTLEDMLHKPIVRFQRNTLLLHDLIKYTPTSHPDYDLLQKTLKFARRFLDDLENNESNKDSPDNQRYLARHGLIVEKINKSRKLRHIFLFNDIIVSAKQKTPNRAKLQYEVKWFIPLTDLSLEDKVGLKDDKILEQDQLDEVVSLQKKISELQAELQVEMKKAKQAVDSSKIKMRKPVTNKSIERIRKKLMEQEASLVIALPSLVFRLYNPRVQKQFLLMMSSDYERTDWRDSITGLLFKAPNPPQITAIDVLNLVNKQKLVTAKSVGGGIGTERESMCMEEEKLYGSLHVRVCQLQGLKEATSAICHIELDTFGHFTMKAKTNFSAAAIDPIWNEDFEIDLDGSQTLRILCYDHQKNVEKLLGKGALELRSVWLKDGSEESCVISINNEMSVIVSLQYTSREKTIARCLSSVIDGLFGIRLDIITARERVTIPLLVKHCVQEIEKRGLDEEGLYRVSGLFDQVQKLQVAFEKNSVEAVSLLKDADVNSLTGLIKLFFRKLPESLFTDALYKNFQEGIGLADPDARDRCLLSLFGRLPEPNFSTAVFLLDHLIKVSKHEEENKMTIKNLATIFGPTLLRPAMRNSQTQTIEQLFFLSAHEAMIQTTILLHFMTLRTNGAEFKQGI